MSGNGMSMMILQTSRLTSRETTAWLNQKSCLKQNSWSQLTKTFRSFNFFWVSSSAILAFPESRYFLYIPLVHLVSLSSNSIAMAAVKRLRALLAEQDNIIVCPGIFDGLTARIALNAGFECLYMVSASPRFQKPNEVCLLTSTLYRQDRKSVV